MRPPAARRVVVALLLLPTLLLAWAGRADAHATLVSASPEDGATLDEAPDEVVLTFTEDVSLEPDGLEVLDGEGNAVDDGDATHGDSGNIIRVAVPADLPDGTYVASYRIVSADGHPISGATIFGIGVDPDAGATEGVGLGEGEERTFRVLGGAGRFVLYGGALVAMGLAVYLAFVVGEGPERRVLQRILAASAGLAAVAMVWIGAVQLALASGKGWSGITDGDAASSAITNGLEYHIPLVLVGLLALALAGRVPTTAGRVLAVGGTVIVGVGFATWGHPRVADPAWLGLGGDAIHAMVAGVWVGGLVGLGVSLRARRGEAAAPETAELVDRVSSLAAISVIALVVAGSALAWSELGGLSPLLDTDYGRLLLLKLGLLAVVLAGAAYNRWRLVPAMQEDPERAAGHLRTTVLGELGGIAAILIVTAVLVDVTPPVNASDGAAGGDAAAVDGPSAGGDFHGEAAVADATLTIDVLPGQVGFNEVHLSYLGADGALTDIAESVELQFTLPEENLGPITREPIELTGGHYTYEGRDLSLPGTWEITVITRISRFEQEESLFTVPIG